MSAEPVDLHVSEARDQFSDLVNRAAFGGQLTRVVRGRSASPAAAIVPASWLEDYEALLDSIDGPVAEQRLAEIRNGDATTVTTAEARHLLGL